jgi:hypothetical protein
MSSAMLELLNKAETVNTNTAKITVVNLKPREDDLFIFFPATLSIPNTAKYAKNKSLACIIVIN